MQDKIERKCRNCGAIKRYAWKEFSRWLRSNPGRPPEDYLCKICTTSLQNWKHGSSKEFLYNSWRGMFSRINGARKSDVKYYVQKGITVCPEWYDYKNFKAWALANGYVFGLVLDRKDSNGNYGPDNCQWLTKTEHPVKDR